MDSKELKIIDKSGKEHVYEIITAFILPQTKKNYVVYTDNTTTEEEQLNVYVSIYYPDDLSRFDDVETEEEWKYIDKILEEL